MIAGIGLERQAEFPEPRWGTACRPLVEPTRREESVQQEVDRGLAVEVNGDGATDHACPAAEDGHRMRRGAFLCEERLLGVSARVPERDRLPGVEMNAALGEGPAHEVGQGEIHVVAADQHVIADGQPSQEQLAGLLADADQGEVGRAAADIADEELRPRPSVRRRQRSPASASQA